LRLGFPQVFPEFRLLHARYPFQKFNWQEPAEVLLVIFVGSFIHLASFLNFVQIGVIPVLSPQLVENLCGVLGRLRPQNA
jgi:hypothetical protein